MIGKGSHESYVRRSLSDGNHQSAFKQSIDLVIYAFYRSTEIELMAKKVKQKAEESVSRALL